MFKQRLWDCLLAVLSFIVAIVLIIGIAFLAVFLSDIYWFKILVSTVVILILSFVVIIALSLFVNWLFIEPYKHWKEENKNR
jgi:formate hydrogenlyase subunit 3/multisubunit Na+/H+ antiporter MnhD subunit